MDMSDGAIVESIDDGYPFGDHMDKLRENAGAFMRHVLSDDDDDMDDEPCVITPDYPSSFASSPASTPSEEQQIRPVALQPPSTEFQIQMMPDSKGEWCQRTEARLRATRFEMMGTTRRAVPAFYYVLVFAFTYCSDTNE